MGERALTLPGNAKAIVDLRLSGSRPAEPIVVSFVGHTGWGNPHVFAASGRAYDWRFLRDLPVYIVVKPGIEAREAIVAIFAEAQLYPTLVDLESKQAASVVENKPLRLWQVRAKSAAWKELFE